VAVAEVVTGGVSSAPFSFTLTSAAKADPIPTASAAAAINVRTRDVLKNVFMVNSRVNYRY
jgi:hypothetical protein